MRRETVAGKLVPVKEKEPHQGMFRVGFWAVNSPLVLTLRNLTTRWVRTVLTTLGIVVGVAAMVAVNATNNSTLKSINNFFDETAGQSDLVVETAVSGESFEQNTLSDIRRFPEVLAAAPGVVGVTVAVNDAADWDQEFSAGGGVTPGTNFWLLGRDMAADVGVHNYELVNGRLLQPGETAYNILLVDEYAQDEEIVVGDDFAILTPNGIETFEVVGTIAKDDIASANEGVLGIAPLPVVQALFNLTGDIGQVELVIDESIANDTEALNALAARMEAQLDDDLTVKQPAARGELVTNSLQSYQQGLNFFSVVSLFVGSFLIYNAFAMTVVERTREIGMLRAVGLTRRQTMTLVLTEAAILGFIGSLAGVVAGLGLARLLVVSVSGFTGQRIEQITATPESLVQAFVVGIVVTLAAALLPALQAARISPLQALRVQGNVDEARWVQMGWKFGPLTVLACMLMLYQVPFRPEAAFTVGSAAIFTLLLGATLCIPLVAGPLEKGIRPFVILLFGNEGRLGSSNIERSRGRTTLTVAALMVGISMVVGINGLTTSFETDIQRWVETALGGDLFVRAPLDMPGEVEQRLLGLEEVTAVTKSRFLPTRIIFPNGDDDFAVFVAVDPATYTTVRGLQIQEGPETAEEVMSQLAAGDALLVGADVANKFNLDVGDVVQLETKRGRRPFTIAAIVIDFAAGETTTVTGSWTDLRRYFGVNDVSSFSVKLAPGASLEAVTEVIENDLGRGLNLKVESKAEFEEKIRQLSAQAFSLFDVLGLIGLVVAALGVINTMLMNVFERTRELGGLRSLGMGRAQVRRMILAEACTIGFLGAIFGVGFGAVLSDVFIIGLRSIGGFVLESAVPYVPMVYSFFIALAVAIVAAWYPAIRASQVNIIEAIKGE